MNKVKKMKLLEVIIMFLIIFSIMFGTLYTKNMDDVDEMWIVVTENPSSFTDDEVDSKGYPINAYKIESEQDIDDLIKRYVTIKPYSGDYRNNESEITEGMSKSEKSRCGAGISFAMFGEYCDDMLYDIRYGGK